MEVGNPLPRMLRGLTLVELITTLAVAGISLAVVIPGWSGLLQRSEVITTANQLLTHLRYARSEAVMRAETITLCPSDDATNCSGDTLGWQRGYIAFVDSNGNRSREPGELLLRVQGAQSPSLRLQTSTGRPAVRFRPDGAAWSTNVTFRVCAGDDSANRAVVLYGSGRARVDRRVPGNRPVRCT